MSKNIKLHPKHGLNPTMPLCFYCGKETSEIALLGNAYKDEAPKNIVISIEPCDECKEKYADYTLLVEVSSAKGSPIKPTGRWCAVKKELLNVPPTPVAYVDPETMDDIISRAPKEDAE